MASIVNWPQVNDKSVHERGAWTTLEVDSKHLVKSVEHIVAARIGHHLNGERDEQLVA